MKIKIINATFVDRDPVAKGTFIDIDQAQAIKLITNGKAIAAADVAETVPEANSLDEMTVAELKTYAATNDIDLEGAAKKDEIRDAIDAAEEGAE